MVKLKGSFVLVEALNPEEKNGSFYIPEQYQTQGTGMLGKVVAIGDGAYTEKLTFDLHEAIKMIEDQTIGKSRDASGRIPIEGKVKVCREFEKRPIDAEIQVGKTVVFPHYAGMEIQIDGIKYLMIQEREVVAVVEE